MCGILRQDSEEKAFWFWAFDFLPFPFPFPFVFFCFFCFSFLFFGFGFFFSVLAFLLLVWFSCFVSFIFEVQENFIVFLENFSIWLRFLLHLIIMISTGYVISGYVTGHLSDPSQLFRKMSWSCQLFREINTLLFHREGFRNETGNFRYGLGNTVLRGKVTSFGTTDSSRNNWLFLEQVTCCGIDPPFPE